MVSGVQLHSWHIYSSNNAHTSAIVQAEMQLHLVEHLICGTLGARAFERVREK
jgi:hypothetical protein